MGRDQGHGSAMEPPPADLLLSHLKSHFGTVQPQQGAKFAFKAQKAGQGHRKLPGATKGLKAGENL